MFDDIATYFYDNVVQSFEDYLDVKNSGKAGRSRDVRAAVNTAIPLYHFREHLFDQKLPYEELINQCPDYALLGNIANASKHSLLTKGVPQISSATQIFEQIVITEYQDEEGPFRWVEKIVLVKLDNGLERNVLEIMTSVMNFWQAYLHSIDVIKGPKNYSIFTTEPRSRVDCTDGRLDFEMVQGLRFKQNMLLQRYNYTRRTVEPIDLTDAKVELHIYKPNVEVSLILQHESTGKEFIKKITLSEKENSELALLKNRHEQQLYIENLCSARDVMRELALEAGIIGSTDKIEPK